MVENLKEKEKIKGLNAAEVQERINNGKVNYDTSIKTKSIKSIFIENIFTLFNLINILLGIAVFCVGSYKNLFFLIVVFSNTAISIVQEIKSKKAIDKLSIMQATQVSCLRDEKESKIEINQIVLDDVLIYRAGNQVQIDSEILEGEVDVNESFITVENRRYTSFRKFYC